MNLKIQKYTFIQTQMQWLWKYNIGKCGQNLKCGIQEHLQALKSNYMTAKKSAFVEIFY